MHVAGNAGALLLDGVPLAQAVELALHPALGGEPHRSTHDQRRAQGGGPQKPPRAPDRRLDRQRQCRASFIPHAVVVARDHLKPIVAGRQFGVACPAFPASRHPVGIEALQLIAEPHFFRGGETQGGELDLELLLAGSHRHLGRCPGPAWHPRAIDQDFLDPDRRRQGVGIVGIARIFLVVGGCQREKSRGSGQRNVQRKHLRGRIVQILEHIILIGHAHAVQKHVKTRGPHPAIARDGGESFDFPTRRRADCRQVEGDAGVAAHVQNAVSGRAVVHLPQRLPPPVVRRIRVGGAAADASPTFTIGIRQGDP